MVGGTRKREISARFLSEDERVRIADSGRFGRRGLPLIALFTVLLPFLAALLDLRFCYGTVFGDRWEIAVGWLAMLVVQTIRRYSRCGSTGSGPGRCGRCRCGSSSPGRCCTWSCCSAR